MLKNVRLPFKSAEKKALVYKRIEVARAESTVAKNFVEQELNFIVQGISL